MDLIYKKFKKINRFCHYFYSGFIGSGLAIISKYFIQNSIFFLYPDQGTPFDLGGDWYAGKGIALYELKHSSKLITVINTHVNARYEFSPNTEIRTLQMLFLSTIIKKLTDPDQPLIVAGDLNTEANEYAFQYLISHCILHDSFEKNKNTKVVCTTNDPDNIYCGKDTDPPRRIDYILHGDSLKCVSYSISFTYDCVNKINYSDHNAVEAILELNGLLCFYEL
ncbi:hypothetical protein HZS_6657 [Henneguya salminicola]|uniref:sphingomyelin phosphodiesterase n=1 Tax=Henneguya salminicola TaxID=69463 RepID=A0A6G3MG48_HENSL|nr:hypothetical protein HZS_6657 [Henneguya salminicola]